jgi:hypothetical protein
MKLATNNAGIVLNIGDDLPAIITSLNRDIKVFKPSLNDFLLLHSYPAEFTATESS